jgi:adenosylcobinamide kinase/adenosylcobinamide-phosphate guanylyltransferase
MIVLVGGGARSGKSAFALVRARALGKRRVFLATAEALDDEMRERIAVHRHDRGADFSTVEAPHDLPQAIARIDAADVVLVDCLTLWISNRLVAGAAPAAVLEETERLVDALARGSFDSVVVTNEVGLGLVPETALGRAFRDVAGRAHQRLAAAADEVLFAALGMILRLWPAPVVPLRGAPWKR